MKAKSTSETTLESPSAQTTARLLESASEVRDVVKSSFSKKFVFDIETDGLLDVCTKMHVFGFMEAFKGDKVYVINEPFLVEVLFEAAEVLIAHNCICFDFPAIEKLFGIKFEKQVIDTLGLSYYLWCDRSQHGLESWGKELGIEKPEIEDWENLSFEEYCFRVEEDVKINQLLFQKQANYLAKIYANGGSVDKAINFVNFKMKCLKMQEENPFLLDVEGAEKFIEELSSLKDEKINNLAKVMPSVKKFRKKSKPKVMTKKDGSLSAQGEAWLNLLQERGLPADYEGDIEVFQKEEEPNPNSDIQVKDWLFSLGWEPCTYKHYRDKATNKTKKVEQIREDGDLTPSVAKLVEKEPAIKELDDLGIISHRISFVQAMLESVDSNNQIVASAHGLTNTLRLRHRRPLANIPSKKKAYGKEIRSLLKAPKGCVVVGSDVVSLEDSSKQHLIFPIDPQYVKEQQTDGYDPHLAVAEIAGYVTGEEVEFYKWYKKTFEGSENLPTEEQKKMFEAIDLQRSKGKTTNFAATYSVGASTLARSAGISKEEAEELLQGYWKKNWAVKIVAINQHIETIDGQMWLLNPVSDIWYSLRYEKDIFSTLNQGLGDYIFNCYLGYAIKEGLNITAQFHDELIAIVKQGEEEKAKEILKKAIRKTNKVLKLNVEIKVDVQVGENYYEVH